MTNDTAPAFESIAHAATPSPVKRPEAVFTMGGTIIGGKTEAVEVRTVKVAFGSIFWPIVAAWAACGAITAIVLAATR